MGTAMITARCFCTPDFPAGEISDLDDDGSWDCVKILEGVMGNAVPEGVRKWQLYRRASRTDFHESQTVGPRHASLASQGRTHSWPGMPGSTSDCSRIRTGPPRHLQMPANRTS